MPVLRTLLAVFLAASVGMGAELHTLSGKKVTGQITSITDKEITIATPTGPVQTPLAQVLDVALQPIKPVQADARRIDFELTDGTVLRVKPDGFTAKGNEIELTLLGGQTVKVKLKNISYYLRDAQDAALHAQLREIMKRRKKTDRLLVLKEDDKTKAKNLNPLEGTFGDIDAQGDRIKFKLAGAETLSPSLKKIQGMVFYRPEANPVPTLCQVYDTHGNVLVANKLTADEAGFKVLTVAGVQFSYDKQGVARLDYNINKVRFLSDLDPDRVVERSASGLVIRLHRDTNLDGGVIRLGGKSYNKGLSVHAYTELEYNLNGKYKEFTAVVGVDDQVGGDSRAQVTVLCDDSKVFDQEVSRKDLKELRVKVKDVNTLKIIVASRNLLDLHDHVTFANAKVSQ